MAQPSDKDARIDWDKEVVPCEVNDLEVKPRTGEVKTLLSTTEVIFQAGCEPLGPFTAVIDAIMYDRKCVVCGKPWGLVRNGDLASIYPLVCSPDCLQTNADEKGAALYFPDGGRVEAEPGAFEFFRKEDDSLWVRVRDRTKVKVVKAERKGG